MICYYDYPFSTPTKNAVNKRIIERPIFLYSRCYCAVLFSSEASASRRSVSDTPTDQIIGIKERKDLQ